MPPNHVEGVEERTNGRVEQLANNFASAVLMPSEVLDRSDDWSDLSEETLIARLNSVADELRVTSSALKWRLVALGKIKKVVVNSLPQVELRNNGRASNAEEDTPPLFSRYFMNVIGRSIEEGKISTRRVARLLDTSVDDLANLFTAQGLKSPILP